MINLSSSSETTKELASIATNLDKNIKKEAKTFRIKDIVEKLKASDISFKSPYSFLDYLEDSGIISSINSVLSIIGKYKETEYDIIISEVDRDLTVLTSQLIYIGTKLGEVQGNVVRLENLKKMTRSKYIIEAIKKAEEHNDKISYAEADSISRVLSEDSYIELDMLTTVEKYLTNLMFNTRFFCETLNNIAYRTVKDEYGSTKKST